ncbi:phosphopantetheine-binding protein [Nannocystis pusilla]|uniref:phosphopantetheine-binding protein n=1 Tax=Nannocystis pusilla TaxID=889268 RepID=UPI003DA67676
MVPDAVHFLAEIPRTDSGKVDDKRLPDIDASAGTARKAAETTLQRELAELVQQILGTAVEVGLSDDFFVLGGQSLRAVELISEINHRYGADVKLREFYREPTIEHLERILHPHAKG